MMRNFDGSPTTRFSAQSLVAVLLALGFVGGRGVFGGNVEEKGTLVLDRVPGSQFRFRGQVGERVKNNVDRWLTQAPKNNPGLLDMFARRDSGIAPDLVPWAGEFVGKYLISGVQAMRMSDDPKLKETLQAVVDRLVKLQAEDGYLGPWPKNERLRGHWDLWGHYHVMLGLMLWHEQTGDPQAASAVKRIADLVCNTFLDTDFRVLNAGSHEMNMGIIHGMARLYRTSGNPRYLRMANEVLKDFEAAGDYYRTGLAGKEFHRTPKPRWESLHSLQGMVELYRTTGDETFRTAFVHHWASIRRFDYRNTGGFSSGEQATGNPYVNDAIETCCVVAFQEVMIDALRLTGISTIADDLEQTTLNAMLGAQHPSGAWCTYNTPMAGQHIPSHIHINFQAREDTPHLNCCSVNGPRGYGSISQWGVMRSKNGLVLNYYGPMTAQVTLADGTPITIIEETSYPTDGTVRVKIDVPQPTRFVLGLRIPAWSAMTDVSLAGDTLPAARPGSYFELDREWKADDEVVLKLDMRLRYEPGDLNQFGKVSLYRGPLLLALDDRFRTDIDAKIDVEKLSKATVVMKLYDGLSRPSRNGVVSTALEGHRTGIPKPWLVIDVPTADEKRVRLIDFANAGATTIDGKPISTYKTWLPAVGSRPPRPVAWKPLDRSKVGPGPLRFVWRRPADGATDREHTVVVADSPSFENELFRFGKTRTLSQNAKGEGESLAEPARHGRSGSAGTLLAHSRTRLSMLVPEALARRLKPHTPYYWKVIAYNRHGQAESIPPHKRFTVDPAAPPISGNWPYGQREPDQMVTEAPLAGDIKPSYGELLKGTGWKPAAGPHGTADGAIELDGKGGLVKYKLAMFPEENYSVSIWVSLTRMPDTANGQVFSAWSAGMDDPLRLVVHEKKLFARIEAGRLFSTDGFPIETNKWYHVAGIKRNQELMLFVDGRLVSTAEAPAAITSSATNFAIGGNPNFSGSEYLPARFSDLKLFACALTAEEVKTLHETARAGR